MATRDWCPLTCHRKKRDFELHFSLFFNPKIYVFEILTQSPLSKDWERGWPRQTAFIHSWLGTGGHLSITSFCRHLENFTARHCLAVPNFCWDGLDGGQRNMIKGLWSGAILKKGLLGNFQTRAKGVKRVKIVISCPIGMGLFLKCRSRKMIIRISYQIWASPYPFQDKRVQSWDPSRP